METLGSDIINKLKGNNHQLELIDLYYHVNPIKEEELRENEFYTNLYSPFIREILEENNSNQKAFVNIKNKSKTTLPSEVDFISFLIKYQYWWPVFQFFEDEIKTDFSKDKIDKILKSKLIQKIFPKVKITKKENLLDIFNDFKKYINDCYPYFSINVLITPYYFINFYFKKFFNVDISKLYITNYGDNGWDYKNFIDELFIKIKKHLNTVYENEFENEADLNLAAIGPFVLLLRYRKSLNREVFLYLLKEYYIPILKKLDTSTYNKKVGLSLYYFEIITANLHILSKDSKFPYLIKIGKNRQVKSREYKKSIVELENLYTIGSFYDDVDENISNNKQSKMLKSGNLMAENLENLPKDLRDLYENYEGICFKEKIQNRIVPNLGYLFELSFFAEDEDKKETGIFLAQHFGDLQMASRMNLSIAYVLTKTLLAQKDPDLASILAGHYRETYMTNIFLLNNRYIKVLKNLLPNMMEAVEYMKNDEMNNIILESNTHPKDKTFSDRLFGNGKVEAFLNKVQKQISENKILNENDTILFNNLLRSMTYNPDGYLRAEFYDSDWVDDEPWHEDTYLVDIGPSFWALQNYKKDYDRLWEFSPYNDLRKAMKIFWPNILEHLESMDKKRIHKALENIKEIKMNYNSNDPKLMKIMLEEIEYLSTTLIEGKKRSEILLDLNNKKEEFYLQRLGISPEEMAENPTAKRKYFEIENLLVTSEFTYRELIKEERPELYDFSVSILPLTKSLEDILGEVFEKVKPEVKEKFNLKDNKMRFLRKIFDKEYFTLYDGVRMISPFKNISLEKNNDGTCSVITDLNEKGSAFEFDIFTECGVNKYLDLTKLKDFAPLELRVSSEKDGLNECNIPLSPTDDKHNQFVFGECIDYIRKYFRNVSAHRDGVRLETAENCREIMLVTQGVIWILLYILRPISEDN